MPEESTYEKVKRLFKMGKSKQEIVEKLEVKEKTVRNYLGKIKKDIVTTKEDKNTIDCSIPINDSKEDLTIENLSERLGINLDEWIPSSIVGNEWAGKQQLKIKYDRIIPDDCLYKAIDKMVAKINSQEIVHPKRTYEKDAEVLLEVSIYDHHFGKLAHHSETGNNYDLKIAKKLYYEAVSSILKRAEGNNIEKILFPIGHDLFHVNNEVSTTAGGTFQDCDGRLSKIFETVQETLINCINLMLEVAPVEIVYIPDNHGPMTSYFMCKVIESYFKDNEYVNVDTSNRTRKYYQYGNTLIGMCHGHSEKPDVLALTMACEAKDMWSTTEFREFHVGHFHKRSERKFNSIDSIGDVIIRYLPSLCGTDKWHETKAFNTTRKFCECYLFDKKSGPIGSLIYNKAKD